MSNDKTLKSSSYEIQNKQDKELEVVEKRYKTWDVKMKALSNGNVVLFNYNTITIFGRNQQQWNKQYERKFSDRIVADVQEMASGTLVVCYSNSNVISIWKKEWTDFFLYSSHEFTLLSAYSTKPRERHFESMFIVKSIMAGPRTNSILITGKNSVLLIWHPNKNPKRLMFLMPKKIDHLQVLYFDQDDDWGFQCQDVCEMKPQWILHQSNAAWKCKFLFESLIRATRYLLVAHVFALNQLQVIDYTTGGTLYTCDIPYHSSNSQMKRINSGYFLFQSELGPLELWHVKQNSLKLVQQMDIPLHFDFLPNFDLLYRIQIPDKKQAFAQQCDYEVRTKRIASLYDIPRDSRFLEMDRRLRQNSIPMVLCDLILDYWMLGLNIYRKQINMYRVLDVTK